jgi:hypothetical protein
MPTHTPRETHSRLTAVSSPLDNPRAFSSPSETRKDRSLSRPDLGFSGRSEGHTVARQKGATEEATHRTSGAMPEFESLAQKRRRELEARCVSPDASPARAIRLVRH